MTSIAIVFHSGYGHTAKQAEAVRDGAATAGTATLHPIDAEGNLPDGTWEALQAADAIIMGSPTYMGSVSWQFKKAAGGDGSGGGGVAYQPVTRGHSAVTASDPSTTQ